MPSVSIITKFALAAGVLVQPTLGLPSSSVRPSVTASRSVTPSHSLHPSSRASSLRPTSTAVPTNGTSNPDIPPELACAAINAEQSLFLLGAAIVSDEDLSDDEALALFAKEDPLPADLVYDCLKSVPINKTAATEWIKWIKPYIEVQSTLGWLKSPPPSYQQPAVDIMGGLDKIVSDISSGVFKGQYDFELAVGKLIQASHDGHFGVYLPLLSNFAFTAPYQFLSVSQDGVKLPEIYVATDLGTRNGTTKAPSVVKTINGKPAVDYLTQFAKDFVAGYIDPQTDWNQLFPNAAATVLGKASTLQAVTGYPGSSNLTLTFANGTTVSEGWSVHLKADFTEILTGQDVYDHFVAPPKPVEEDDEDDEPAKEAPKKPSQKAWGVPYPAPVVVQKDLGAGGSITGYFLNKSSTAVLSLPTFDFEEEALLSVAPTFAEFLAKCKSSGMKRLVIDVQSNGGGVILTGFELFRQLFPTVTPFAGSQLRLPSYVDLIGTTLGAANASIKADAKNSSSTYFYGSYLTSEGKEFPNWASAVNPQTQMGDKFTNTLRVNFTKQDEDIRSLNVSTARAPQVFQANDIMLLTDGSCGSTCTILAEELHQVGVKIVVAGGRPEPGAMQGIGGVRGSQVSSFLDIASEVTNARAINTTLSANLFPVNGSCPLNPKDYKGFQVNLRNQIRKSKQDVPLQFVYQAADCRIFYTKEMLADYTNLWQYAVDALWTNPGLCVQGSTRHPSAAQNVTTITAVSKNNGTSSTPYITTNGAGSSNGGLNMALLTGVMVSLAALLL